MTMLSATKTVIFTAAMSAGVLAAGFAVPGESPSGDALPIAALAPIPGAFAAPNRPASAVTPLPAMPMVPRS
jgi:hypothetical protein